MTVMSGYPQDVEHAIDPYTGTSLKMHVSHMVSAALGIIRILNLECNFL